ncbi:protein disulfide oxidoreductase [Arcobacteraceae bacterium]|nr:protein disulfide oxidoreductase [Arcobacteraceae bacterium]
MNKFKYYLKEIIKSVLIITIVLNAYSYYQAQDLNNEKLPLSNISLNNKPIMIHFWATWCPVCKIEAPNIQRVSKDYNVLTIASQSGSDEKIKEYLKTNNVDFKVINDYDNSYAKQFNITVFPTTLIYDKDKNLVSSEVGYTSTFGLYLRMWWANL